MSAAPGASIIVCTRNRAELLEGSLRSLLAQRPATDCELVVVDNASTDATADVIERCAQLESTLRLRHVTETRLGLSNARNRGTREAAGDLLLYTDDDVLVEPGWVDSMCAGFADADVVAVAGRVVPEWPQPPPRWIEGRHAGILALTQFGDEPRDLAADEVPVGASMGIRRAALAGSVEPFDARLGHSGGTYYAYEEHALFLDLHARGRLVYRPDAVVHHRILPVRRTWEGMRRAVIDNGYGSRRAERLRGEPAVPRGAAARKFASSYAAARRASRRNGGRDDVDPDAAFEEFAGWWELGRATHGLFGESRVGRWLLARFV